MWELKLSQNQIYTEIVLKAMAFKAFWMCGKLKKYIKVVSGKLQINIKEKCISAVECIWYKSNMVLLENVPIRRRKSKVGII